MTNRERLQRAVRDLERVMHDQSISPTPYTHLVTAAERILDAAGFALDMNERDGIRAKR